MQYDISTTCYFQEMYFHTSAAVLVTFRRCTFTLVHSLHNNMYIQIIIIVLYKIFKCSIIRPRDTSRKCTFILVGAAVLVTFRRCTFTLVHALHKYLYIYTDKQVVVCYCRKLFTLSNVHTINLLVYSRSNTGINRRGALISKHSGAIMCFHNFTADFIIVSMSCSSRKMG